MAEADARGQVVGTKVHASGKTEGGGGEMAPGPTRDLWWNRMDWKTVKEKYHL